MRSVQCNILAAAVSILIFCGRKRLEARVKNTVRDQLPGVLLQCDEQRFTKFRYRNLII